MIMPQICFGRQVSPTAFHFWLKRVSLPISVNPLTCGFELRAIPTRAGMARNVARNSAQRPGSHGGRVVRGFEAGRKFS